MYKHRHVLFVFKVMACSICGQYWFNRLAPCQWGFHPDSSVQTDDKINYSMIAGGLIKEPLCKSNLGYTFYPIDWANHTISSTASARSGSTMLPILSILSLLLLVKSPGPLWRHAVTMSCVTSRYSYGVTSRNSLVRRDVILATRARIWLSSRLLCVISGTAYGRFRSFFASKFLCHSSVHMQKFSMIGQLAEPWENIPFFTKTNPFPWKPIALW